MDKIDFSKYGLNPVSESNPDFKYYGLNPIEENGAAQQLINKIETENPVVEKKPAQSLDQPGSLSSLNEFGPVMYQNPAARAALFLGPTTLAPEITGGANILGRTIGAPLLNTLSRIGTGTAGNVGYDLPNINNLQDLTNSIKHNLYGNALLEFPTLAFRVPNAVAETFNPMGLAEQKANQIRNEFSSAKSLQNATYQPVKEKYGEYNITLTPQKYLDDMGIERNRLYDQSKQLYDKFKNEPTFWNLHELQSQLGYDLRQARVARNKPASVQRFNGYRNKLKEKAQNFLSHDEEMLAKYNAGGDITKNLVEPYRANPTLEKIAYGVHRGPSPDQLHSAISKGKEKIVARKGENAFTAIPPGHPLEKHLNELNEIMNFGNLAKGIFPVAAGVMGGELLHPGLSGGIAGGLGGLGGAGALLSAAGNPVLQATVQNPFVKNVFNKTAPPYYLGGRAVIANTEQGQ